MFNKFSFGIRILVSQTLNISHSTHSFQTIQTLYPETIAIIVLDVALDEYNYKTMFIENEGRFQ